MLTIPLQSVPSQTLKTVLDNQYCTVNAYTLTTGLYLDLSINGNPVVQGVLCLNLVRLVQQAYLGFLGDLIFVDGQGANDPDYTGLGGRYTLIYLEASDL